MHILQEIQKSVPNCMYHVNIGMGRLPDAIEQYDMNLNPPYQRGYIWTLEQRQKFVGACLENHNSIPSFWINWKSGKFHRDTIEIVDGKQRINAILEWLNNGYQAICPCGISIWHKELDEIDIRTIKNSVYLDWNFVELDEIEVMKFYIRLNSGGTVHSKTDLDKVLQLIEEKEKNEAKT